MKLRRTEEKKAENESEGQYLFFQLLVNCEDHFHASIPSAGQNMI